MEAASREKQIDRVSPAEGEGEGERERERRTVEITEQPKSSTFRFSYRSPLPCPIIAASRLIAS